MKKNIVQACIATVSFPATLEALYRMLDKHGSYETDMDSLLYENDEISEIWWTAAKWLVKGDILFFYHTKSALQRIKSLLKKVDKQHNPDIWNILKEAEEAAIMYGGTIFGYGIVQSLPENRSSEPELHHFKGRIFAPIDYIHIFEKPLNTANFTKFISIGQSTITSLDKKSFDGIHQLLIAENDVPEYFRLAIFSEIGFHNISKNNWLQAST